MLLQLRTGLPRIRFLGQLTLIVLAVLGALGGILVVRAARGGGTGAASWTIRAEHFAEVRESAPWLGAGRTAVTRSTARIWFAPGAGWRMEVESTGDHGSRHRVFGTDGVSAWGYDPITNRYTLTPSHPGTLDPRSGLAVMMATTGTTDGAAALAALQRVPGLSVVVEGEETVAGRPATVLFMTPHSCAESGRLSTTGDQVRERRCDGFSRVWLDMATGWVLRAHADDGRGGGFLWDTPSVVVGGAIDPGLWHFVPPPGSVRVDALD